VRDHQSWNEGVWVAAAAALPAVCLAVAYATWVLFDQLGGMGPLDRAKLGWLVTIPLIASAPGLAAAALSAAGTRRALVAVGVVSVGAATFTTWLLMSSTTRIGCDAVSTPWQVLPSAAIVGLVAGMSLFAASAIAARISRRLKAHNVLGGLAIGATLGGIGGAATLFALSVAFPAVLCAPPIR
jgi:MFS family permease